MPKPELHYHGCHNCRRRYPDACETPTKNGICPSCKTGRLSIHMTGIEPRECCRASARVANKNDLKTYRLRGSSPWWLCMECARQFPFDPRITNV